MKTNDHPPSSAHGASCPAVEDPRIVEALEQYLAAMEAGQKPNRQAFLARHADLAGALDACLDGLEALEAASSSGRPAAAATNEPAAAVDLQPEAPLGDFRIVREIGRGGMGIVYEAVQLSLGRRVALKVLPFAAALDAKQLQRFKNEAQAAAHLHHTNIVPVYAVGVERGVHFYAMQLIEGQNLAAVIAELRGRTLPAASSRGTLSVEARRSPDSTGPYAPLPPPAEFAADVSAGGTVETLSRLGAQLSTQRSGASQEFFRTVVRFIVQVAEALDYAHSMGIIHRDIKPANLVVDARGNVWVTDFGLAQFHANTGLTQTGDLLGTLRYMSPEQASGQRLLVDHRADVYSLGATLYELLTLRPIFDGADRQALLHQILNEEPRRPRAVDRSIPPELETIVLKAIGKAPGDRYATAREFADDLQRFLRYEPIRARRATPLQRARKWLRRHPAVLSTGVGLLVLLTVGSILTAWIVEGEHEETLRAYQSEQRRAKEAEVQYQIARKSVNDLVQLADEELADFPPMEGLRKRLLESALAYYQQFIDLRQDDPDTQIKELQETRDRVNAIIHNLVLLQGDRQLTLLNESSVLEDLHATAEQRKQLQELAQQLERQRQNEFRAFYRRSPEEREKVFERIRASKHTVEEILTAEQLTRLKQIARQLQGAAAFRESDVATTLELTAQQKSDIRAIEAESFFHVMVGHRGEKGRGKPPSKPPEQTWREQQQRIVSTVLKAKQAELWHEMIGAPFEGEIEHCPPFGPPRPGFGPPNGRRGPRIGAD